MIMKQELVSRIREYFDLNIYETKVWLALLSRGIASAGEIAVISGVPRSRTYDVLESLEKRGFALIRIGKPVKYIALKPEEVLEKMKSNVMNRAQEKVVTLSNLRSTNEYEELEKLHRVGISPIKAHEITGSFKGRSSIISRLKELIQNASRELIIYTSLFDFEDKSRILAPLLEEAVKRDVKLKIALTGDADKIKKLSSKIGIKILPAEIEAKIYIADKKELVCMITQDRADEEVGLWLNSPFLASALTGMASYTNGKK